MKKFKGIYPALITPFDKQGEINEQALQQVIEMNIKKGVSGFYVGGSSGESYLLSTEERKQVLECTIKTVAGRVDVIANIGMFATAHSVSLAEHAKELGVAAISSVPPFYFKFSIDEYVKYYNDIVDAVDVPMIIYNIPALSGVGFTTDDLKRFFENEKIIGMKHTSYDLFQMQKVIEQYPQRSIFIGYDELFLPAYSIGARAAIGSSYNFLAEKFIKMEELFLENETHKALIIQAQANEIMEVLCEVGVFKGIKAALKMQGIDCGVTREPFIPLTAEAEKMLEEVLIKTNCL